MMRPGKIGAAAVGTVVSITVELETEEGGRHISDARLTPADAMKFADRVIDAADKAWLNARAQQAAPAPADDQSDSA